VLILHEKFIVDEKGKKTATVLPYTEWKKVTAMLGRIRGHLRL